MFEHASITFGDKSITLAILVTHGEQKPVYEVAVCQESGELTQHRLIIKPQLEDENCDSEDTVDLEAIAYDKLPHLQGGLIPIHYGIWDFQHGGKTVHAHVIEKVNGKALISYPPAARTQFKDNIRQAYSVLSKNGVVHGDAQMRHIFIMPPDNTIKLIDFDVAEVRPKDAEAKNNIDCSILFDKIDNAAERDVKKQRGLHSA